MVEIKDLCKQSAIVFKPAIRMKDFIYIQLLFCATSCSICVDTAVYRNLASQLTLEECRELVASLHYSSYVFPAAIDQYLKTSTIPKRDIVSIMRSSGLKDDFCTQLLVEWYKKAGKNSTHVLIEGRLRQMNKFKLADWLGKTVFHQLATDINDTLLGNPFADSNEELALNFKLLEDKALLQVNDKLTRFDFVLRLLVIILFVILMVVCCRIVWLSYVKRSSKDCRVDEERRNLLSNGNTGEN